MKLTIDYKNYKMVKNMAEYRDFSFELDEYGKTKEYSGVNAIIMAIKNILLSRPGNFPFTPDLGLNIDKYQFELLDDYTLSDIKNGILYQINKFVPAIDGVAVSVDKVESEIRGEFVTGIGISVSAVYNGENVTANFLVLKDKEIVHVYNETFK